MARTPISIPDTSIILWTPIECGPADDNIPGPLWKLLTSDRETGAITYMTFLPPGWKDEVLDWHPSTEEGFRLGGGADDEKSPPGRYLYRQPGILHGPAYGPKYEGVTILQRMDRPMRILRYNGTKYPHKDGQPITDEHKDWPVDNVRVKTDDIPWEQAPDGGWAGTEHKWLHRNRATNGGALLIKIPAGWKGTGTPGREVVEEFVVEGSIVAGGEEYVKWGYVCRAAGDPAGTYESKDGATLFTWWDSNEFE